MSKTVNAIFARGKKGEFALPDGSLPWWTVPQIEEFARLDMDNFKKLTTGSTIIIGYNTHLTFKSPLPKRRNIVIARNPADVKEGFEFAPDLEEAVKMAGEPIFVIGGAKLLEKAFGKNLLTGKIYETVFDWEFPEASVTWLPPEMKLLESSTTGIVTFNVWERK